MIIGVDFFYSGLAQSSPSAAVRHSSTRTTRQVTATAAMPTKEAEWVVTKDQVDAALKDIGADAALADSSAAKQIQVWKKKGDVSGSDEELTRLYLALRTCKGGRVTPGLLSRWSKSVKFSAVIERKFYLVPKGDTPALGNDKGLRAAIVDKADVENMPENIDPEDVWIVDAIGASAHKGKLGNNVSVVKLSVKASWKPQPGGPAPMSKAPGPPGPQPSIAAEPAVQQHSAPKVVKRTLEEPIAVVHEEDAFETIAKNTLEALKAKRIAMRSALRKDTVEKYLQEWVHHVKAERAKQKGVSLDTFLQDLSPWCLSYIPFVVDRLLSVPEWTSLAPPIAVLAGIKKEYSSLVPPIGHALIEMAAFTVTMDKKEPDFTDIAGFDLAQRTTLFNSIVWVSFLEFVDNKRYDDVLAVGVDLSKKPGQMQIVDELLESSIEEAKKEYLRFVRIYNTLTGSSGCNWGAVFGGS